MALFSQILVNIATAATMAPCSQSRPLDDTTNGRARRSRGHGIGRRLWRPLHGAAAREPRLVGRTAAARDARRSSRALRLLANALRARDRHRHLLGSGAAHEDLLAGTGIDFVRGEVRGLDEAEQVVRVVAPPTANGEARAERLLPYDQCVLAFGSQPTLDRVEGAAEYAQPFYSTDDALAVKRKVRQLREDAADSRSALRVCVVGGGYIGAELAANLASSLPSSEVLLTLVHRADALLTSATDHSREVAVKKLADAGVDVILNTEVELVTDSSIRLVPVGGGGGGGRGSRRPQLPQATQDATDDACGGGRACRPICDLLRLRSPCRFNPMDCR